MEQLRLEVNGITFGILQHGETLPAQQTLVCLHGFTGCAASWSNLFERLERPGRRLLALDMLGHGLSDAPADPARYAIEHCENDILDLLQDLGVRPQEALLLGYSMGGRVALYTAFSGFFRGVVLESASPGLCTEEERLQRQQSDAALAAFIEQDGVEPFINYWERLPLFASQSTLSPDTLIALRRQRLHNRPQGLANSLRGLGTGAQPCLYDRLQDLKLPVLLLTGQLDTKFCQIARTMAGHLPQSRLEIVPEAGHTIHLEQPDIFARHIDSFFESVLDTTPSFCAE